jgi:hypothetical protein
MIRLWSAVSADDHEGNPPVGKGFSDLVGRFAIKVPIKDHRIRPPLSDGRQGLCDRRHRVQNLTAVGGDDLLQIDGQQNFVLDDQDRAAIQICGVGPGADGSPVRSGNEISHWKPAGS